VLHWEDQGGILGGVTYRLENGRQYIVLNPKATKTYKSILDHEFFHARMGAVHGDHGPARELAAKKIRRDAKSAAEKLGPKLDATDTASGRLTRMFGAYSNTSYEEFAAEAFAASRDVHALVAKMTVPFKGVKPSTADVRTVLDAAREGAKAYEVGW